MTERQAFRGQKIVAGGTPCTVTLADGQVRVHLPFTVDPQALSRQLRREGYPLAHQPDTPDTQGWGPDFSGNGYYPYWVYPDPDRPGRSVFAFYPNPEDVVDRGGGDEVLDLGKRSHTTIDRWVPVLTELQSQGTGALQ